MTVWSEIVKTFKEQTGMQPRTLNGKPIQSFVVPVEMGKAGTIASAGKSLVTNIGNLFKRSIGQQFAGRTLKQGITEIGKSTAAIGITGATFGTAFEVNRALSSGQPMSINTIAQSTTRGATFGLNPLGAISGIFYGEGERAIEAGKTLIPQKNILDVMFKQKIPQELGMSKMTDAERYIADIQKLVPSSGFPQTPSFVANITSPPSSPVNVSMSMPSGGGYSFSPSVSAGGGMGEILPLILLLGGGAGLAGYIAGRKKKKKYKRRKKRK